MVIYTKQRKKENRVVCLRDLTLCVQLLTIVDIIVK